MTSTLLVELNLDKCLFASWLTSSVLNGVGLGVRGRGAVAVNDSDSSDSDAAAVPPRDRGRGAVAANDSDSSDSDAAAAPPRDRGRGAVAANDSDSSDSDAAAAPPRGSARVVSTESSRRHVADCGSSDAPVVGHIYTWDSRLERCQVRITSVDMLGRTATFNYLPPHHRRVDAARPWTEFLSVGDQRLSKRRRIVRQYSDLEQDQE